MQVATYYLARADNENESVRNEKLIQDKGIGFPLSPIQF